jgi:hypothetical protein
MTIFAYHNAHSIVNTGDGAGSGDNHAIANHTPSGDTGYVIDGDGYGCGGGVAYRDGDGYGIDTVAVVIVVMAGDMRSCTSSTSDGAGTGDNTHITNTN